MIMVRLRYNMIGRGVASMGRRCCAGIRLIHTAPTPGSVATEESLIPTTLKEMDADAGDSEGVLLTAAKLKAVGQKRLTLEERKRRRRALDAIGVPEFEPFLSEQGVLLKGEEITRRATTLLQVNVGLYCNQACNHCHVESSPKRTETMSNETVARIIEVLAASPSVETLDITGGAPEMNAAFRPLVEGAVGLGVEVIDRCNLTVMVEPSIQWLGPFLAEHKVRVVASLPCYSQRNVDTQRGNKVFERSIEGLRRLNALGYGAPDSDLKLDLVYNPGGAFLPPPQEMLHAKYTEELQSAFGITFNELFTMTNMPIKRFQITSTSRASSRSTCSCSWIPSTPVRSTTSCAARSSRWRTTARCTTATSTRRSPSHSVALRQASIG